MSAPDTDLKKQERRHRGPLWGILAVLVLVAVGFFAYLAYTADTETPAPAPDASQVAPDQSQPAEGTGGTTITDTE